MRIKFLFLLIFILGCTTIHNPATHKKEVYFIDTKTEVMIGKNIANKIINENKLVTDFNKVSHIRRLGNRIATSSDRKDLKYFFYILDEEGINAFSVPGGYIFVNKGLLDETNKDELAFVLAHEIAHVAARHSVKRLQASLGINLILSIALRNSESSLVKNAVDVVYNVVSLGYARQDEFLADSLAVKYTHRGGYNVRAGLSLMEKLKKDKSNDYTLIFLRSHPPASDRIKNIEETIRELE